jgi:hypothetical protein
LNYCSKRGEDKRRKRENIFIDKVLLLFTRMPQKNKLSTPAAPVIGQNAKTFDELLQAIKDEYVYNTRVSFPSYHISL